MPTSISPVVPLSAPSIAYGLPSVIGWWDASTLPGADTSTVQTWRDLSTYGQDLIQTTSGVRPTLRTNQQGGKSIVRFGATSYMQATGFGASAWPQPSSWVKPNTYILVAKISSAVNLTQRVLLAGGAASGRNNVLVESSANRLTLNAGSGSAAIGGPAVNDDAWHVFVCQFDTGSSSVYIDGFMTALAAGTPTEDLSTLNVGATSTGTSPANQVDIAELIILNDRLSPAQVLTITNRLAAKWSITSTLPASQDSTPYIDTTSSNGQLIRYWTPRTWPAASSPLVIYSHPASGDQTITPAYFAYKVLRALVNEGYAVVASNMHGDNWGNDTALADILDAYNYMNALHPVSKVLLWGCSMGGLATARAVRNSTVPTTTGAMAIDAVLSLGSMYSSATYNASINTAWGVNAGTLSALSTGGATSVSSTVSFPSGTSIIIDAMGANPETVTTTGAPTGAGPYTIPVPALAFGHASAVAISDYPAKTAAYDPALLSAAGYGTTPWRFHASAADVTVLRAPNADAFKTKINALATESVVVTHLLGHLDSSVQNPADVVAFARRCLA